MTVSKFSALTKSTPYIRTHRTSEMSVIKHECPRRNTHCATSVIRAQARTTRDPNVVPTSAVRHVKSPKSMFTERRAADDVVWVTASAVRVPEPV